MRLHSTLRIILLLQCTLMLTVAGRAGDAPAARDHIVILSTSDIWSELAACG